MKTSIKWGIGGTLILAIVSSLLMFQTAIVILTPAPIYLVIFGWMIGYYYVLVMPAIYILFLAFAGRSNKYATIVLIVSLVLGLLDCLYFYTGWEDGVTWQGRSSTVLVAIINVLCFVFIFALAAWARKSFTRNGAHFASLSLFLFLSWGAFPYLGEYP